MRWLLAATTIPGLALGTISAALAADVGQPAPVPVYTKAPPVYTWTGFYVGGDVGGFSADQSATTTPFPSPGFGAPAVVGGGLAGFGQTPTSHSLNSNGVIGGLYAGYNWQWNNWLVTGVEGDFSWLDRNASNTQVSSATFTGAPVSDFNMNVTASNHMLASVRGRFGLATGPALFYATGGAAWTKTSYSANAVGFNDPPSITFLAGTTSSANWDGSKLGLAIGGGVDWRLPDAWSNWILRAEYLYYQFDGASATMSTLGTPGGDTCAPGQCSWNINTSTLRINTVRAGLSYKF
jgi:outer membrane immunogenic protein